MATLTVGLLSTYPTIQAALVAALPGDTIKLAVGYSNETATITKSNITVDSGALSAGIHLKLATGIANVQLTGTGAIDVVDNTSSNTITGNAGDNVITVTGGLDAVDGGLGDDRLVIDYHTATTSVIGTATTGFAALGTGSVTTTPGSIEHFTVLAGSGSNTLTTGAGNDYIETAGAGDNLIDAGEGNNTVKTGAGVDTITVGSGNDIINAGEGANTITGIGGDKLIVTGAGADTITVTDGNNNIFAGEGANTITAVRGNNIIHAGSGVDTITVTSGTNIIYAGDGANTITATSGNNTIYGGTGVDTIAVTSGGNYIDAGNGANTITASSGNDTIISGTDTDTIFTGAGDDSITVRGGTDGVAGGVGNDTLVVDYANATTDVISTIPVGILDTGYAGAFTKGVTGTVTYAGIETFDIRTGSGDDLIYTGGGNDTINTGAGADYVHAGGGADLIYGGVGDVIDGGETGTDFDTLNLYGIGRYEIDYDPMNGENGTVYLLNAEGGRTGETLSFTNVENIVACFTPGTLIATPQGARAIETLKPGDLVLTLDHGFRPIVWVGIKRLSSALLAADAALQPISIQRGAFGNDTPNRDMLVSRQHRMMVSSPRAELLFDTHEVLVRAKHLVSLPGIEEVYLDSVTYIHIMFDEHEIVLADGAWSESFQPGDRTLAGIDADQRQELAAIFPELSDANRFAEFDAARLTLKAHEALVLLAA